MPPTDAAADADPRRRDCQHHHTRHDHGTRRAYVHDKCRCQQCRVANRTAQQSRRRAIAYGRWEPFADARPIRAHVATLRRGGMSVTRIAQLSGVSRGALQALLYGKPSIGRPPNSRTHAETAQKILAIQATPDGLPEHAQLADGRRAVRRLQALVSQGWSVRRLARVLDSSHSTVARILSTGSLTLKMDRQILALFEQLAGQPVPATTAGQRASVEAARRYAAARGWGTRASWDDIDSDAPPVAVENVESPIDQVAVDRAVSGTPTSLTPAEIRLAVEELSRRGIPVRKIAERLRRHPRTVRRYRSHHRAA